MRLTCSVCHAGLVPSWSGLHCPRMAACGRGGLRETAYSLTPFTLSRAVPTGVTA